MVTNFGYQSFKMQLTVCLSKTRCDHWTIVFKNAKIKIDSSYQYFLGNHILATKDFSISNLIFPISPCVAFCAMNIKIPTYHIFQLYRLPTTSKWVTNAKIGTQKPQPTAKFPHLD